MQAPKKSMRLRVFGSRVLSVTHRIFSSEWLSREWFNRKIRHNLSRWFKRRARGMTNSEYENVLRQNNIIIGKDGRLQIPSVEFPLAHGCNLKCEFCSNMSPFRAGVLSKDMLLDSFKKWSQKISPGCVVLIGGEPLLHPDIAEIVTAIHHYWSQSRYMIATNGVLLPRVSDDVLRVFAKYNVHVKISQHLDTPEYRKILKQSLSRLTQFRIKYKVAEVFGNWWNMRGIDEKGVPVPCHSNPVVAYEKCPSKYCTTVEGDYMYSCAALAGMITAVQGGSVGPEWNRVLTHKPLFFESSPQEIRDYLFCGPMPECSVCPESSEKFEPRQLSMEDVQRIKQHIQERHRKAA